MAFLANAFFQAALLKYVLPNQPEVYINMNNVDTFEVDRAKNTVYLYYRSSGAQAQTPNQATRTLQGATATAFIADIDALFLNAT